MQLEDAQQNVDDPEDGARGDVAGSEVPPGSQPDAVGEQPANPTNQVGTFPYDITHTRAAVEGNVEALSMRDKELSDILESDREALKKAPGAFKLYCGTISCFDPVSQRAAAAFRAVSRDDVEALKAELQATPELRHMARNKGGQTLLEVAQERRCTRVAELLLQEERVVPGDSEAISTLPAEECASAAMDVGATGEPPIPVVSGEEGQPQPGEGEA